MTAEDRRTRRLREPKIVGGVEYFWIGDEEDAQCARCGSSTYAVDCWNCGGEGFLEDDWEGDPDRVRRCDICGGDGGWQRCCSSREYCEAHPMPGREAIKSSARENWEGEE